jgi:hypothetical protein
MCSGTHIKRRKEGPDGPSQRKTKIIKKEEEKDDKAVAPYLVGEKKKKEAECVSLLYSLEFFYKIHDLRRSNRPNSNPTSVTCSTKSDLRFYRSF